MKLLQEIKKINFFSHTSGEFDFNKSVSVVGSSGILLSSYYGQEIDNSDDVIRFNEAKTLGLEKHAGSKDTIRILNCHTINNVHSEGYYNNHKKKFPDSDRFYLNKLENKIIIFKAEPSWQLWEKKRVLDPIREKNNVAFLSKEGNIFCRKLIQKEPSCGFLGLLIGLRYYDEVVCYGFNFNDNSKHQKHYYRNLPSKKTNPSHDFKREKQIFQLLHKAGVITLVGLDV